MYCPHCATIAKTEQKYCRTFGLALPEFERVLSAQLAGSVQPHENELEAHDKARRFRFMFGGLTVIMCGFLFMAVVGVLKVDRIMILPGFLMFLCGALLTFYGQLYPQQQKAKRRSQQGTKEEVPLVATTTDKLTLPAAAATPVASVIEHTTRNLAPIHAQSEQRD